MRCGLNTLLHVKKFIRRKRDRVQLFLAGVAFLFGGIASLEGGNVLLAAAHFLMALLNMLAATIVLKHPFRTKISIFIINAVFSGVVSYLYYRAGNDQMPYAWGFISLIFIVGCVVFCIRSRRQKEVPA